MSPAVNTGCSPHQGWLVLWNLAEDMEAAAIEAGDHADAGAGRAFAAQRAIQAGNLREAAHHVNPLRSNV
ncbi:hypothetical protein ACIHDR_48660 [Nocardia sp. NPDC052278]|uniref:hypothetical protein n=1 Tax=unclassified Nocardia TaxID=2637762 RepID=UPI00367CFBE1